MDQSTKFWLKVNRPNPAVCWEWQGGKDHGYGVVSLGSRTAGRMPAHRMAWELVKGPIPEGKHVLHHCDNPPCVNPAHLYLGTDVENARDRVERGRAVGNFHTAVAKRKPGWNRKVREDDRRGYANRKFTDEQEREIAWKHKLTGISKSALAREYGVSQPTITAIIKRALRQ